MKQGEKFGVGRSTVREAVKSLVSKGVLEVRRGDGTYAINTASVKDDPLGLLRFIVGIYGERMTREEVDRILQERKVNWKPRDKKYKSGVLRMFSEHAASPMKGAHLEY